MDKSFLRRSSRANVCRTPKAITPTFDDVDVPKSSSSIDMGRRPKGRTLKIILRRLPHLPSTINLNNYKYLFSDTNSLELNISQYITANTNKQNVQSSLASTDDVNVGNSNDTTRLISPKNNKYIKTNSECDLLTSNETISNTIYNDSQVVSSDQIHEKTTEPVPKLNSVKKRLHEKSVKRESIVTNEFVAAETGSNKKNHKHSSVSPNTEAASQHCQDLQTQSSRIKELPLLIKKVPSVQFNEVEKIPQPLVEVGPNKKKKKSEKIQKSLPQVLVKPSVQSNEVEKIPQPLDEVGPNKKKKISEKIQKSLPQVLVKPSVQSNEVGKTPQPLVEVGPNKKRRIAEKIQKSLPQVLVKPSVQSNEVEKTPQPLVEVSRNKKKKIASSEEIQNSLPNEFFLEAELDLKSASGEARISKKSSTPPSKEHNIKSELKVSSPLIVNDLPPHKNKHGVPSNETVIKPHQPVVEVTKSKKKIAYVEKFNKKEFKSSTNELCLNIEEKHDLKSGKTIVDESIPFGEDSNSIVTEPDKVSLEVEVETTELCTGDILEDQTRSSISLRNNKVQKLNKEKNFFSEIIDEEKTHPTSKLEETVSFSDKNMIPRVTTNGCSRKTNKLLKQPDLTSKRVTRNQSPGYKLVQETNILDVKGKSGKRVKNKKTDSLRGTNLSADMEADLTTSNGAESSAPSEDVGQQSTPTEKGCIDSSSPATELLKVYHSPLSVKDTMEESPVPEKDRKEQSPVSENGITKQIPATEKESTEVYPAPENIGEFSPTSGQNNNKNKRANRYTTRSEMATPSKRRKLHCPVEKPEVDVPKSKIHQAAPKISTIDKVKGLDRGNIRETRLRKRIKTAENDQPTNSSTDESSINASDNSCSKIPDIPMIYSNRDNKDLLKPVKLLNLSEELGVTDTASSYVPPVNFSATEKSESPAKTVGSSLHCIEDSGTPERMKVIETVVESILQNISNAIAVDKEDSDVYTTDDSYSVPMDNDQGHQVKPCQLTLEPLEAKNFKISETKQICPTKGESSTSINSKDKMANFTSLKPTATPLSKSTLEANIDHLNEISTHKNNLAISNSLSEESSNVSKLDKLPSVDFIKKSITTNLLDELSEKINKEHNLGKSEFIPKLSRSRSESDLCQFPSSFINNRLVKSLIDNLKNKSFELKQDILPKPTRRRSESDLSQLKKDIVKKLIYKPCSKSVPNKICSFKKIPKILDDSCAKGNSNDSGPSCCKEISSNVENRVANEEGVARAVEETSKGIAANDDDQVFKKPIKVAPKAKKKLSGTSKSSTFLKPKPNECQSNQQRTSLNYKSKTKISKLPVSGANPRRIIPLLKGLNRIDRRNALMYKFHAKEFIERYKRLERKKLISPNNSLVQGNIVAVKAYQTIGTTTSLTATKPKVTSGLTKSIGEKKNIQYQEVINGVNYSRKEGNSSQRSIKHSSSGCIANNKVHPVTVQKSNKEAVHTINNIAGTVRPVTSNGLKNIQSKNTDRIFANRSGLGKNTNAAEVGCSSKWPSDNWKERKNYPPIRPYRQNEFNDLSSSSKESDISLATRETGKSSSSDTKLSECIAKKSVDNQTENTKEMSVNVNSIENKTTPAKNFRTQNGPSPQNNTAASNKRKLNTNTKKLARNEQNTDSNPSEEAIAIAKQETVDRVQDDSSTSQQTNLSTQVCEFVAELKKLDSTTVDAINNYKKSVNNEKVARELKAMIPPRDALNRMSHPDRPPEWFLKFIANFRKQELWRLHQMFKIHDHLMRIESAKLNILEKVYENLKGNEDTIEKS